MIRAVNYPPNSYFSGIWRASIIPAPPSLNVLTHDLVPTATKLTESMAAKERKHRQQFNIASHRMLAGRSQFNRTQAYGEMNRTTHMRLTSASTY